MENDHDKMELSRFGNFSNVVVFPTPVMDDDLKNTRGHLQEIDLNKHYRGVLGFNGDFSQQSDTDNLEYLLTSIWPKLLEDNEELKLDVFGNGINRRVLDLCKGSPNVRPVVDTLYQGHTKSSQIQSQL